MKYHVLEINGKELKCRLTTTSVVQLEKKYGQNLMMLVIKKKILGVSEIADIINASLTKFEHGYTVNKVYDLIDDYVDNGGDLMKLQENVMDIFKVSGFFADSPQENQKEVDMEEVERTMKLIQD